MHPLLRYTELHRDWLLETVETLVRAESPSTNKAAVDCCGELVARRLSAIGAKVETVPQRERGDHIRAVVSGADPQVLVLGHLDTVWEVGQIERMPVRQIDGRLHGPGVYDMKAGLATAMLALRAVLELDLQRSRIVLLFTSDEEVGSQTSRALIEEEARRSAAVLVLEPSLPGGGVKTSRKGVGEFQLTVRGVSAHAGIAPAQGANAVHELAHQILALQALQDPARGVNVNVTVVSGGTRTNVIPDRAVAHVDVRVATLADAVRIEQALKAVQPVLPGTRLEVLGTIGRPPLERGDHVARLYEVAQHCARELGRELQEGSTGGASDGNFSAALGVSTLDGLGPQGDGAHADHEHVLVDDLPWRAALVACLLSRAAARMTR